MTNKQMKVCSPLHVIKELQIKTTTKYHYRNIRMTKIQNIDYTKFIADRNAKCNSHLKDSLAVSYKNKHTVII